MDTNKRDYYKVLIVGASGKGKTYMARNLNPETTGFLNIEDKPLPFPNKFKNHKRIDGSYRDALTALIEMAKDPSIDRIFIDSFSAYGDKVLKEARATKKGFDIWSFYNDELGKFLEIVKKIQKEIVVTAHYELMDIEGMSEKRVKVKAKEWAGVVEKEFTIVMYADNKYGDDGKPEYYLSLSGEGISAKCPPAIFGEDITQIPNDAEQVLNKIVEFATSK